MRATAHDVADLAGVSVYTVWRAPARPSAVSQATRARVVHAAATLGYIPKVSHRSPDERASAIGLVVDDVGDPYTSAVIEGVRNRANGAGYTVTVVDADGHRFTDVAVGLLEGFGLRGIDVPNR